MSLDFKSVNHSNPIKPTLEGRYGIKFDRFNKALCPFHDDKTPSFQVYPDTNRFYCHGCEKKGDIIEFVQLKEGCDNMTAFEILGGKKDKPIEGKVKNYVFDFIGLNGKPYQREHRKEDKTGKKTISQSYFVQGKEVKKKPGNFTDIPYCLPELVKAKKVVILEGTKKAYLFNQIFKHKDYTATSFPNSDYKAFYRQWFKGKEVYILPDLDKEGQDKGLKIANNLYGVTTALYMVRTPIDKLVKAGKSKEKDLADFIEFDKWKQPDIEKLLSTGSKYSPMTKAKRLCIELFEEYELVRNEITGKKEASGIVADDYSLNTIYYELIEREEHEKLPHDKFVRMIDTNNLVSYNPIKDFFDNLPEYDGKDYIKELCEKYIESNDTIQVKGKEKEKRIELYLKLWLTGCFAQGYHRKKNELIPVLVGGQDIGKTTFIERLFDEKYNLTTGTFDPNNEEHRFYTSDYLIINLDELNTFSKRNMESIKDLISSKANTGRKKYAREKITRPRVASFIGSTNHDTFLDDLTGNRRWLPVNVYKIDSFKIPDSLIRMCWSQAKHLYNTRDTYFPTPGEKEAINRNNIEFEKQTTEEEYCIRYLEKLDKFEGKETLLQASYIRDEFSRLTGNQKIKKETIGKILKKLGFIREQRKIDGKPITGWLCKIR